MKFLAVWPDIGVLEIVESIYSVEIVEFEEFVEIVENCGIVLKLSIRILNRGLGVPARIDCPDAFSFSDTNKNSHRARILITYHMFEEIGEQLGGVSGDCGIPQFSINSTIFTNSTIYPHLCRVL